MDNLTFEPWLAILDLFNYLNLLHGICFVNFIHGFGGCRCMIKYINWVIISHLAIEIVVGFQFPSSSS